MSEARNLLVAHKANSTADCGHAKDLSHQPSSELAGDSKTGHHFLACDTSLPQQVHPPWIQVLEASASAEQQSAGLQVSATVTHSVLMLFCKDFIVFAQVPPKRPHLTMGVAQHHSSLHVSAFLIILCLLLNHQGFFVWLVVWLFCFVLFSVRTWCLVKCICRD